MEDVEKWISDCEGKKFIDIMGDMTAKIHENLEYRRTKSDKVTAPLVNSIKKVFDYIMKECNKINTENEVIRARLEDRRDYCNMMGEFAEKITRASVSSVEDVQTKPSIPPSLIKNKDDFSIIVTPKEESHDVMELKQKIKDSCRKRANFPVPQDVVTTKNGQVILKYKSKKEVDLAKNNMEDSDEIKDMVKINVPIRRRERILILSVDPTVEESGVKR